MSDEREAGLTIIGGAGRWPRLRLAVENVRSWEWESFPRREPKPPRERLAPLRTSARANGRVNIPAQAESVPDGEES
jgi:hypothetical protein